MDCQRGHATPEEGGFQVRTSETTKDLVAALAAAQGEFPKLERNRTVQVKTKTGGSYEFSYATLDHIYETFRPILAKHGLSLNSGTRTEGQNGSTDLLL